MSDHHDREARRADEAVNRIHTQLSLEGKLDKAYATEGAVWVFGPLLLLAVFGAASLLAFIGLDDEARVVVGSLLLVPAVIAAIYLATKNETR